MKTKNELYLMCISVVYNIDCSEVPAYYNIKNVKLFLFVFLLI